MNDHLQGMCIVLDAILLLGNVPELLIHFLLLFLSILNGCRAWIPSLPCWVAGTLKSPANSMIGGVHGPRLSFPDDSGSW
ncbi:hypothetical protein TMatcc_007960 [Talaromyces marneffei ATCC 18224]